LFYNFFFKNQVLSILFTKEKAMEYQTHYAKNFKEQFNWRVVLLGAAGSSVISMSSMYVALRLGALPWPTIFVAILSMALLKLLKNTNVNEINATHTGMSAGAMVAGGIAFTIPGIWIIQKGASVSFLYVLTIAILGVILGVMSVVLIRAYFIERSNLPYPVGVASAQTVLTGDVGGRKAYVLFTSLGLSAIFTALRDGFNKIPQAVVSKFLNSKNIPLGLWLSPMAFGIGYIIGPLYMGMWFLGSIIGNLIIVPIGLETKWFLDLNAANAFKSSLGIGMIIGGGIGILVKDIIPKSKEIFLPILRGKDSRFNVKYVSLILVVVVFIATLYFKLDLISSILLIFGVWVTVGMAAYIDGATGIDPLEIFGIIVLLVIRWISSLYTTLGMQTLFAVAGIVAVATGIAGDNLQDFKSGSILHTDPNAQILSELIGGVSGAFFAAIAIFVMHATYKEMGPNTFMPAPQAFAVSSMIKGLPDPRAFIFGLIMGIVIYFFGFHSSILGIGIYLPFIISGTAFLGGVARIIVKKFFPRFDEDGILVSSGLLGGEGVAGVLIAIIKFIGGF
jgi:putative OPT family oligopeptide transporter